MLLGTLVPERGRLYLRRTLPRTELERGQVWPVVGGETVLAFAFAREGQWYCEGRPGRLVQDPVVRRQLSGPMLCSRDEEGFRLAVPFRTDSPVVLNTLLCLANVELLSGKPHLVWRFDGKGRPKV